MIRLISYLSACFLFGLTAVAHAESTRFYCSTEDAAELVGHGIVVKGGTIDKIVVPMIESGICFWSPADIEILVIRRGKTFTSNDDGVFVAAFIVDGGAGRGRKEFYALVRYTGR